MANPQPDKFIRISTELWEAICRIRIPGEARQVLDTIIRKTYGYHKKEDQIALSQFCLCTNLSKTTVCKAIGKLISMNLITQKGNDRGKTYRFNKDYSTWKPLPKRVILPKKEIGVTQKGNPSLPKRGNTIDTTTKDTITKDNRGRFTPPSLVEVSNYCKDHNYDLDCEAFLAFYESKGWMIGKNKMKSWQAAVVTWVKRDKTTKKSGVDIWLDKKRREGGEGKDRGLLQSF